VFSKRPGAGGGWSPSARPQLSLEKQRMFDHAEIISRYSRADALHDGK
jgi:hypothetical protein